MRYVTLYCSLDQNLECVMNRRRKKRLSVFVTKMSLYNLFIIVRVCHEIFYLYFCHDLNPSVPLTNGFKYFFIFSLFWKIFKFLRNFAGAMCIPPLCQYPRCASHLQANLRGVHHIVESIYCTWCASHRGVNLRSVHHTRGDRIKILPASVCF